MIIEYFILLAVAQAPLWAHVRSRCYRGAGEQPALLYRPGGTRHGTLVQSSTGTRVGRRHTDRHRGRTDCGHPGRCVAVPAIVTQPLPRLLRSLPSPQAAPLTYPAHLSLPMQAHSCERRLAAYLSFTSNQGQRPPPCPLLPTKPRRRSPTPSCTGGGLGRDGGHAAGGIATHAAEGDWRRYEERERQASGPAEGDGPV